MNRFLSRGPLIADSSLTLDANESRHGLKVLRKRLGDSILLIDGKGSLANAQIVGVASGLITAKIESVEKFQKPVGISLAFGLPKGPALEFILRRCTEVGVSRFQPITTQHSMPENYWRRDRSERTVEEVSKQCQCLYIPEILDPVGMGDYLGSRSRATPLYFCDENSRTEVPTLPMGGPVDLLVGAEGGWSDIETKLVRESGAIPLGLGQNRLRAETAALAAAILIYYHRRNL